MCFAWIWEQTAIISLYSINLSVFKTEAESVYCAVRNGSLNQTYIFVLRGLSVPEHQDRQENCHKSDKRLFTFRAFHQGFWWRWYIVKWANGDRKLLWCAGLKWQRKQPFPLIGTLFQPMWFEKVNQVPYYSSKYLKWNTFLNLLKPTGHVMHQQFNIQQLYVLPTLYLCVLYLSENKQRLVPLT